jgi:4-hydroxy-tetrahydrodipicolinate synthase
MLLSPSSVGVFPIAPTPFRPNGEIDIGSIDRLIATYRKAGANGVTVLGMMGEAQKLDASEAVEVAAQFIKGMHVPVIVGVSAPGFAAMRSLTREVMSRGAAGVMIAPPPHLRTDDQIVGYFKQAVEAIGADVPFVIQDYPLVLTVQMSPKVIRQIVQENPSCVMLKHEDWPGLDKISTLRRFQKEGSMRGISILTGNGGSFLDFELERGADGAMTGYAFPEVLVALVRLHGSGRRKEAHDLFDRHLPLIRYELQPVIGLAIRKYIFAKRGILESDALRVPWTPLSEATRAEVDYLFDRLGDLRSP